jgi:hypothetical protein
MNGAYLTFKQLCRETGLSKYRIRYFQTKGYFEPFWKVCLADEIFYDRRWVDFWNEYCGYKKAGLDEFDALSDAYSDVFGGRYR